VAYKPEEVRQRLEETMTMLQEEATAAAETT